MQQGIDFLTKWKRWRMGEVTWSVHHSVPALDRAGLGTNKHFRYMSHQDLSEYVSFELKKNNECWSVGKLWSRVGCMFSV